MFRNVRRTCWNKYADELEQKLNEQILPPVSVPSSKENIDMLANKVHSVTTKSINRNTSVNRQSVNNNANFFINSLIH